MILRIIFIAFSLLVINNSEAALGPMGDRLHSDETARHEYDNFRRLVRAIYQAPLSSDFHRDFENRFRFVSGMTAEKIRLAYEAWNFLSRSPASIPLLHLIQKVVNTQDWTHSLFLCDPEKAFRALTHYVSRNPQNSDTLMWDPEQRSIWVLYSIFFFSSQLSSDPARSNVEIANFVRLFQRISQEDFVTLFCHSFISPSSLKDFFGNASGWFVYKDGPQARHLIIGDLESPEAYFRDAARLLRLEYHGQSVLIRLLQKCYQIPNPRRTWIVNSLVQMGEHISRTPFEELNDTISQASNPALSEEGVVRLFHDLTQHDSFDRRMRASDDRAAEARAVQTNFLRDHPHLHMTSDEAFARIRQIAERGYAGETRGPIEGRDPLTEEARRRAEPRLAVRHPTPIAVPLATEIHDYAQSQVHIPETAAASRDQRRGISPCGSTSMALNDAIFHRIRERVGAITLVSFSEVERALGDFSSNPAFESVLEDPRSKHLLQIVYTFLKTFHSHQIELWKRQFITESLEAYRGRRNATSCTKGIEERILTGLRGIDPELDLLFKQVEGRQLMKVFAASVNPQEHPRTLARQLLEIGMRPSTSPTTAAQKFKEYFNSKLEAYGLMKDPEFEGHAEILADLIKDALEDSQSLLSKALKEEFGAYQKK